MRTRSGVLNRLAVFLPVIILQVTDQHSSPHLHPHVFPKFIITMIWFWTAIGPLAAQYQIDLNVLTVDEGLSQNLVNVLFTDSRGFLWIGTNDGLNRFDGYENRIFQWSVSDTNTIASNTISTIEETSDGSIIVGHYTSDISIWNPKTAKFRRYKLQNGQRNVGIVPGILNFAISKKGAIYALKSTGLLRYDSQSDRFEELPFPVEMTNLRGIFAEADTTLLLFTFDQSVHRYHLTSGRLENLNSYTASANGYTFGFAALGNNHYALASHNSVYLYDAISQKTLANHELSALVTALTFDGTRVWVSTTGFSVYYWNPMQPEDIPVAVSPTSQVRGHVPQIRALTTSKDGIVWLGTIGNGLSKLYDTSRWFGLLKSDPNAGNTIMNTSIRAIYSLSQHEIIIGGYSGLERYDFRRMESRALLGGNSGNPAYISYSIIADQLEDSVLWIGTEGDGLLRLDLQSGAFQQYYLGVDSYSSNVIKDLIWVSDTQLMLGSANGLLFFDTQTRREVQLPGIAAFAGINVGFIKKFTNSEFFVGTGEGILLRIRRYGSDLIPEQLLADDLAALRLISMNRDSSGDYWLGTNNGILRLNAQFQIRQTFTMESGLPNNTIYSLQFDASGNLWTSTNFGISRLDVRTQQFTNFNIRDGLQSNEFNTKSYANFRNKVIYLGGISGLNFFNPTQIITDARTHPVFIETLSASSGDYRVGVASLIELPFTDSEIRIGYSSPVFYNPRSSDSWYRLVNLDTTWRRNPIPNELILAGLQPGVYQLQLARSSAASLNQAPVSEVWFRIRPPIYQLWYVQFGAFLFIVALITFSMNTYLQKLRETIDTSRKYSRQLMMFQDEERRRVAEALHDSIGSKLMLVKLSFRQVLMRVKDDFAEQKYQEINSLIGDTITEIREISQNLHPHLLEKIGLSKSIIAFLESLQEMAPIRFSWQIDSFDAHLNAEESLLFYRFVQESITNVLKHSEASQCHVSVMVDLEQGLLITEIRDNGVGMSKTHWEDPAETMGLRSFKERAVHLGAVLEIDSKRGKGTIIRLQKPCISTHG